MWVVFPCQPLWIRDLAKSHITMGAVSWKGLSHSGYGQQAWGRGAGILVTEAVHSQNSNIRNCSDANRPNKNHLYYYLPEIPAVS